ncbi:MAG TPA: GAF domain-containing protein, partial [Chloroflexota bacterium]
MGTVELTTLIERGDQQAVETLVARLRLLDALAGLARITAGSQDPVAALDGFSAALRPLIPHDWVNVAWLEDDQRRFHLLGPIVERPEPTSAGSQQGDYVAAGCPILSHTLTSGAPQVVDDYHADPRWPDVAAEIRAGVERRGLRAGLVVPLRVGGRIIGALVLDSRQVGQFTETHLTIAQHVADHLAPFVENLRLYQIERRQREHIEALNAIGRAIAASLDVDDVFPGFAAAAQRLIQHDRVGVDLLSDDGTAFETLAWTAHYPNGLSWGDRVPVEETSLTLVLRTEGPVWSNDLRADTRVEKPRDRDLVEREGIASVISVPLRASGRVFGLLTFSSRATGCYSERDVGVVQQVADQIAPFLANVRLYRQVRAL